MPLVSPGGLVDAFLDAFQQSGASGYFVGEAVQTHPRQFIVERAGNGFSVWVYVWNLTHGGRSNLPDEYRIQMTSVDSPLALNRGGYTVLMGYHPDLRMFAGFDLFKHKTFTAGSSSVQIDIGALHRALQMGLSFHRKSNDEIAVGVRPDQMVNYIFSSKLLHKYGVEAAVHAFLNQATDPTQKIDTTIEQLSTKRQQIVTAVTQYSRNGNFRKAVLNAYDNRCAVTRAQMRLVDAAHILPVPAEGSSDHVSNGISLSPTLHRAYDNCLIYLDCDLVMRMNEERATQLINDGLDAGLDTFCMLLNRPIHLPIDVAQRPHPEFIAQANTYRRIPGYV